MNKIAVFDQIDAALIAGELPPKCANAWMAAGDNATGTEGSDEFKISAVESLSLTAPFQENESVREYFDTKFGYQW
jgi:hypothetical protein